VTGTIDPPCGVPAHRLGRWDDEVLGIWWCPDCHEEIWVTEGADDERLGAPEPERGSVARLGETAGNRRGAAALPGLPGDPADRGDAAGAPGDRAPADGWRDSDGGARLWSLILEAFGRAAS
jgi:hypothetical protein